MDGIRAGDPEVIVIGGGPAGAGIARLLASRGRSVTLVVPPADPTRGLGESLPPSARKSLAAVGVLEAVESAGFCASRGNRVAWGGEPPRLESFDTEGRVSGFQVWRPALDRLLLDCAVAVGATVESALVRRVEIRDDGPVDVTVASASGATRSLQSRFVVDASGRAGVIARRYGRVAHPVRTHAWIGLWQYDQPITGSSLETTLVESCDTGWAWSVPVSPTLRCAAVMVDPDRSGADTAGSLETRYRNEIARARHLRDELRSASFVRVWGADATPYRTRALGGPTHLVIGDAAQCIDPLSSIGVKKALASAWHGAAVVETCLATPALASTALEFFSAEEQAIHDRQIARSAEYAARACAAHDSAFWRARADVATRPARPAADDPVRVRAAFDVLRSHLHARVRRSASAAFTWKPAIAGHAIALERAVTAAAMPVAVRYLDSVDLPALVDLATESREVGELFERYCRTAAPVPLPNFLKALSVLVAGQALEAAHG